ncbi:NADAR family protein [Paraburkholderia sp. EG287A]|uniref:NADAR family protein n=1 Tax=Paraburkholderia sp. EG287A TaxID=3237012 RepID=UPI0034D1C232
MKTTDTMVLFWQTPEVYSNWHVLGFRESDIEFVHSEQYMMWCKAMLFGDAATAAAILKETDARTIKYLGRAVKGYQESAWQRVRMPMMVRGCWLKFSQNAAARAEILATGDRILVEASPYDMLWGIGLTEDDPRALDQQRWLGRNLLGEALMEVRRLLRAGEEAPMLEWLLAA